MDKLKPCPFCGGEAKMETFISRILCKDYCAVRVYCPGCETTSGEHRDIDYDGAFIQNAINAWNRRCDDATD